MNEKESTSKHFTVHDILLLRDEEAFISSVTPQPWVDEALRATLAVIVRRGPRPGHLVPVGVRGLEVSQRCAGFVAPAAVTKSISPEYLVEQRVWRSHPRRDQILACCSLERFTSTWASSAITWGPIGIIGFELATELPLASAESDLDIIIRAAHRLSLEQAKEFLEVASSSEVHVNIHLETPQGELALMDYLRQPAKFLVQTDAGPKLVPDPWAEEEM